MKKNTFLAALFLLFAATINAQTVSNVWAEVKGDRIAVHYTLATNTPTDLTLHYSADNGRNWYACKSITGNLKATTGSKTIFWDSMSEGILKGGLLFKVSAELTKVSAELIPMVFVQGGTFTMGCTSEQGSDCGSDEKPAHKVTVSDFYIGKYPVTQAQWKAVMGSYPKELHNTGCDDCPVDNVSWDDAQGFIKKLNAQTGKTYRLPTEAEWEYAARGGAQTKGYKYSGSNNIGEVAWYDGNYKNSKHGTQGTTHPVGTKKPNELGIYDMSGNVWEWCSDWYGSYSSNAETNPKGPNTGSDRVSRGGSWIINALSVLSVTGRSSAGPGSRRNFLGFRVVLP